MTDIQSTYAFRSIVKHVFISRWLGTRQVLRTTCHNTGLDENTRQYLGSLTVSYFAHLVRASDLTRRERSARMRDISVGISAGKYVGKMYSLAREIGLAGSRAVSKFEKHRSGAVGVSNASTSCPQSCQSDHRALRLQALCSVSIAQLPRMRASLGQCSAESHFSTRHKNEGALVLSSVKSEYCIA